MATATSEYDEDVILHGIPWEIFEAIDNILGECHLRLMYVRGTLELRKVILGVSWEEYEQFLEALGDFNLPHSYDHGELRMMSPRRDHDDVKSMIARMLELAAFELDIPMESLGSTTLAAKNVEVSIQPDEAYYVQNERKMRTTTDLDLERDPPPDLALEVIVTHRAPYKLSLYAQIGVPEVWRYDGKKTEFLKLAKNKRYNSVSRSLALPKITPEMIVKHLKLRKRIGEHKALGKFLEAIRGEQ